MPHQQHNLGSLSSSLDPGAAAAAAATANWAAPPAVGAGSPRVPLGAHFRGLGPDPALVAAAMAAAKSDNWAALSGVGTQLDPMQHWAGQLYGEPLMMLQPGYAPTLPGYSPHAQHVPLGRYQVSTPGGLNLAPPFKCTTPPDFSAFTDGYTLSPHGVSPRGYAPASGFPPVAGFRPRPGGPPAVPPLGVASLCPPSSVPHAGAPSLAAGAFSLFPALDDGLGVPPRWHSGTFDKISSSNAASVSPSPQPTSLKP